MAYSTNTTILTLLPGLPQTTSSAGYTNTAARVASHISRADNIINAKISSRYNVVPFATSVPPLLQTLSEDIASYFTFRSEYSGDSTMENAWTDKFKMALDMLEMIRKGDMDICDSSGGIISERSSTGSNLIVGNETDYTPFFGKDTCTSWQFDRDELQAMWDKRK